MGAASSFLAGVEAANDQLPPGANRNALGNVLPRGLGQFFDIRRTDRGQGYRPQRQRGAAEAEVRPEVLALGKGRLLQHGHHSLPGLGARHDLAPLPLARTVAVALGRAQRAVVLDRNHRAGRRIEVLHDRVEWRACGGRRSAGKVDVLGRRSRIRFVGQRGRPVTLNARHDAVGPIQGPQAMLFGPLRCHPPTGNGRPFGVRQLLGPRRRHNTQAARGQRRPKLRPKPPRCSTHVHSL